MNELKNENALDQNQNVVSLIAYNNKVNEGGEPLIRNQVVSLSDVEKYNAYQVAYNKTLLNIANSVYNNTPKKPVDVERASFIEGAKDSFRNYNVDTSLLLDMGKFASGFMTPDEYAEIQSKKYRDIQNKIVLDEIRSENGQKDKSGFAYQAGSSFTSSAAPLAFTVAGGIVGSVFPGAGTFAGANIGGTIGTSIALGQYATQKIDEFVVKQEERNNKYGSKTTTQDILDFLKAFIPSVASEGALESVTPFKMAKGLKLSIKSVLGNVVKEVASETLTEGLQAGKDLVIDTVSGNIIIDPEKLPEQYWKDVSMSMGIGASYATPISVTNALFHKRRAKNAIKEMYRDSFSNIKNDEERERALENFAEGVYNESIKETFSSFDVLEKALNTNTALREKHGEIYNKFKQEIKKTMDASGAFDGYPETEIAMYIETISKKFADIILIEANKRKVSPDEIIEATKIVYEDGKLYLNGKYFKTKSSKVKVSPDPKKKDKIEYDETIGNQKPVFEEITEIEGADTVRIAGKDVPVEYTIVEADTLLTSHGYNGVENSEYPSFLQNRDRSRKELIDQVVNISENIDPKLLMESHTATDGAPIITNDGYVAIGNGRGMAIVRAYDNGKADAYKQALVEAGYDIEGFERPVLVRRMLDNYSDGTMRGLIEEANTTMTASLSNSEQALTDAGKLSDETLSLLDVEYDIDTSANSSFVKTAFNEIIPSSERGRYLDDDGFITADALRRIKSATLGKIIPNQKLLSSILESDDEVIRKASKGLMEASALINTLESKIKKGEIKPLYTIKDDIQKAFTRYIQAKRSKQDTDVYLNNKDMFEQELTPAEQKVLDIFLKSKNSGEVKNRIARYVQSALNEGNALQPRMLGEALTKEQILDLEALHQEQIELYQTMKELDAVSEEYTADTININGKERPVYNSEGNRIAKSEKALRAFYKWFGDSKVVDSQGRPLVVYHGTPNKFDTFDIEKFGKTDSGHYGKGFYFEMRRAFAKSYGKKVMKVYLKANNIFNADNVNLLEYLKETNFITQKKYKQLLKDSRLILDMPIKDRVFASKAVKDKEKRALAEYRALFSEALKEQGYDGIQHYTEFVVFSPNQIKSVDNRGTFDLENPNIYYQTGVKEIDSREPFLKERENGPKIADDNETVEVVKIPEDSIPDFETKVQLRKWLVSEFEKLGSVMIKSTNQQVVFDDGVAKRVIKNARNRKNNFAYPKIKDVVENAKYSGFREKDEKHNKVKGQDIYHSAIVVGQIPYSVEFYVDIPKYQSGKSEFAGNKIRVIKIAPADTQVASDKQNGLAQAYGAISNISLAVLRGKVNPARYDSENNRLYQRAYVSMKGELVGDYLDADEFEGTGEGAMAHGWGNYLLKDRETNKTHYYDRMSGDKVFYNGIEVMQYDDMPIRYAAREFAYAKDVEEAKKNIEEAISKAQVDITKEEEHIKNMGKEYGVSEEEIELLNQLKDIHDSFYELSIIDANGAKLTQKEAERKLSENAKDKKDYFYMAFDNLDSYKRRYNGYREALKLDFSKFEKKKTGAQYEAEVPEDKFLLDENKFFNKQSKVVRDAINEIAQEMGNRFNEAKLRKLTNDKYPGSGSENWKTYYGKKAFFLGKQRALEYIHNDQEGTLEQELTDFINNLDFNDISDSRDFNDYTGKEIYQELDNYYGSQKRASKLLEKYGIKGIKYDGRSDGIGYVIFKGADVPITRRLLQSQIDEGNLIPLIDTSAFGEDMFEGLEEIDGKKFIPVYNLGKLREFAEKIADKIVEASDFAKSYVSQSKKSEATYINLYARDEDFSPRIKIRLATHKPIHYESISTFYYDLNKTLKENMVELNNLIKGKEFGQVSTGREQQAMIDALYGTDRGVWGNAFSFEGLEDNWFGQSAKAREERRSFVKGSFDPLLKAIELTKDADLSTLPHEFSHFWLDNIWGYIESGNASKEYIKRFEGVMKYIGAKKGERLTREQHEKFARAYEKFLFTSTVPQGVNPVVFDEYEDFIHKVYNEITEIDERVGVSYEPISEEMYHFFNSMVRTPLPEPVAFKEDIKQDRAKEEKIESEARAVDKEVAENIEARSADYNLKPVQTDTKTGYLTAFNKRTGAEVEAGAMEIQAEFERAKAFVESNLELAEKIVNGEAPAPVGYVKNLIYMAYEDVQARLGNTKKEANSMINHALELRRYGQEITSERMFDGEINPINYISEVIKRRTDSVIKRNKKLAKNGKELSDLVNRTTRDMFDGGKSPKEIVKHLSNKLAVKPVEIKFKPKNTEKPMFSEVLRFVEDSLGIGITEDEAIKIISMVKDMNACLKNSKNEKTGNPTLDYFEKMRELENYINEIQPSSELKVLVSLIGRGNLLFSIKTPITNIVSTWTFKLFKDATRRIKLGVSSSVIDSDVVENAKQEAWDIYAKTGYHIFSMKNIEDFTRSIRGEGVTHSQGEGSIRALGRFYEKVVYGYGLGYADTYFKNKVFTDYASLLATKMANGDKAKATAMFKDACLVEPLTSEGKEIREKAREEALVATYQEDSNLSKMALKMRKSLDFGVGFGEMIAPFVKTPVNVVNTSLRLQYGGVIAVGDYIIRSVRAGRITEITKEQINLMVENGLGFVLSMIIASMIDDDDYMPPYALADNRDKEIAQELNIAYNSVRFDGVWVSLDYIGVLAPTIVGILQARKEEGLFDKLFGYGKGAVMQVASLPVTDVIADFVEGSKRISNKDGEQVALDTFSDLVDATYSRAVPMIVTDIVKVIDDYERETGGSTFKASFPLTRFGLEKKMSVATGKEAEGNSAFLEIVAGSRAKAEVDTVVGNELKRLNDKGFGVTISDITRRGKLADLEDKDKTQVRKEYARKFNDGIEKLINTSKYKRASDEDKSEMITKLRNSIRNEIKKKYK